MSFFLDDNTEIRNDQLFLIAGPCVLDNTDVAYEIASAVVEITKELQIPYIFKASYAKANRTSSSSYRGIGMEKGLAQLERIKKRL